MTPQATRPLRETRAENAPTVSNQLEQQGEIDVKKLSATTMTINNLINPKGETNAELVS
jgi:hypothetical protein